MCTLEFPELEKNIHKRYAAGDVVVVGVNPGKLMMGGESPAVVQQFMAQTGATFVSTRRLPSRVIGVSRQARRHRAARQAERVGRRRSA